MSMNSLEDVLFHSMTDLLSAEKQFRDALPKLSKAAEDDELASAFKEHQDETKKQIERLQKAFEMLGRKERSEKCEAAEGLVTEGKEVIEEEGEAPAKDVMLTSAGRKAEHYEIASYTDAVNYARVLGHSDIAGLLQETLDEEQDAAQKLEGIGERLAEAASEGAAA